MDNRIGSSHAAEIPKKSRSLDLKSLYRSKDSKEAQIKNLKRKGGADVIGVEKRHEKKSRKGVAISSFRKISGNGSKSLEEVYNGSLSSGSHDPKDSKLGLNHWLNDGSRVGIISQTLEGSFTKIPRRKRGFVGRRKVGKASQVSKASGQSSDNLDNVNLGAKLADLNTGKQVESIEANQTWHDGPEERDGETVPGGHIEEKDRRADRLVKRSPESFLKESDTGVSVENVSNASLKKSHRKRSRKKKDSVAVGKGVVECVDPSADLSVKKSNTLRDDDEENLEENAARMLSSRFDPNCTGFSSNSKSSALPSSNDLSLLVSPGHEFVAHGADYVSGSESADVAGRMLRPRNQNRVNGNSRKRRHYYEVFSGDLDAYWVLNRRIKVFWPLDRSWYHGLVSGYDKLKKLHHIRYDDRDEEWIDLHNERFKLLLLPSEVPGKPQRKKTATKKFSDGGKRKSRTNKEKRDLSTKDDSYTGNCMDSEPIISWLARSTHRPKSSPHQALKKQKTSGLSTPLESLLLDESGRPKCARGGSSKQENGNLSGSSALPDNFAAKSSSAEFCHVETELCNAKKFPLVYQRRKFRNASKVPRHVFMGNYFSTGLLESDASFGGSNADRDIERSCRVKAFWMIGDSGLLKLNPVSVESRLFRLEFSLALPSINNHFMIANHSWLFHSVFLLHYGTLITMWPRVQLEILFVDNAAGLRFVIFEGCLIQAIAIVLQVLAEFHQPTEEGKFMDLHCPVTSMKFKISYIEDIWKQIVFAFYNFSEVKISKWVHLDSLLGRHSSLTKKLPLSECTYHNVKALRNGSVYPDLIRAKGTIRQSRHIFPMGVSRESTHGNTNLSPNSDKSCRWSPPFGLSFAEASSYVLRLHLKQLIEHSATFSSPCHDTVEHHENSGGLPADDCSSVEDHSSKGFERTPNDALKASRDAVCNESTSCAKTISQPVVSSVSRSRQMKPSANQQNGDFTVEAGDSAELTSGAAASLKKWRFHHSQTKEHDVSPKSSVHRDKSSNGSQYLMNNLTVEISSDNQLDKAVEKELHGTPQSVDLSWNMNGGVIPSPNPTARRSTWHRNRSSSTSSGYLVHGWSEGRGDLLQNNFSNGPKKPRTQVSYALPFGGLDYGSKHKNHFQKGIPNKRIRTANEKRSSDVSRGSGKNLEMLSCEANVLVTLGDRGWRESGVQIVLELSDQEWKLAVKLAGITRYLYKAHQFLQPGSTNRYTHAMMWKGGKDWILEFPDRSQWALFKEMHEECYNRNFRAALVKNIPIPGVRLIEENDENGIEVPFVRSPVYCQQLETDVDFALNPSRVLYDLDSDDEEWLLKHRTALEDSIGSPNRDLEEMFEKTMDLLEKAAFSQQREEFTSEEIEELIAGVGTVAAINIIYEYWQQKRQRSGMPLIRHLQPPQWERYSQQVKEWELTLSKSNTAPINGSHEKVPPREKPPMYAFCLKPRGLEVPNKGLKHRSQRKISVSLHGNTFSGYHDALHTYGRRLNGFASGDERFMYQGHNYEPFDDSPYPHISPRLFSPRDSGGKGYYSISSPSDRYEYRRKTKKPGAYMYPYDTPMLESYSRRVFDKRRFSPWNMEPYEFEGSTYLGHEQFSSSDLEELRMRDATGAARHAVNVARFKRDKARRLLYRADLAIHKAVVALMTAEAIKTSSEDTDGEG